MENLPLTPVCVNDCDVCCDKTIEEQTLEGELKLRNRAFNLSAITWIILLIAHVCFAYAGKNLPVPEPVWVVLLCPFGSAALSKIGWLFIKGRK